MSYQPLPEKYAFATIEPKWQNQWFTETNVFAVPTIPPAGTKPYYVLEMLPYPSGQLHMGHVRNYTLGDVLARYKRAAGFTVMHPMGWDSFGLPAENAAIKRGIHPREWTLANIAEMKTVMQQFGWSYDWSKEITTCLPSYYGPQQALFLDFYDQGLVYKKEALVNWDPIDQTVLANEQVVDGKGWRSGAVVERRSLSQWFMRITALADELLGDLDTLPGWPARVRTMQENWLGKSQGLQFTFKVSGYKPGLEVFTTRPDTLYGATFCAIAPEHPLAKQAAETDPAIAAFIKEAESLGTAQEVIDRAEKKGVRTPFTALHPLTGDLLPIFVANFVLMTYGTGAIMAVPAHDPRDHAFATKYQLPIQSVITAPLGTPDVQTEAYTGDGVLINSAALNGLASQAAMAKVMDQAESQGWGKKITQWRLRDWGISRQRYWGAPIPFIHCAACGTVPVPREALPVLLPDDVTFTGTGNPLAQHPTWKHTACPTCGGKAERETDTMDTFMDSSWYFLRYLDPQNPRPINTAAANAWLPQGVDQYIGGIEHAVLHLLYARFFTKALKVGGQVQTPEPFANLLCQGMLISHSYQDAAGNYIYPSQVRREGQAAFHKETNEKLTVNPPEKISKSKNNGDSPDALLAKYGADALRLFILFAAPPERDLEWSEAAIDGAARFLNRVWTLAAKVPAGPSSADDAAVAKILYRKIHQTIAKVTQDIERFSYNTLVAAVMELANALAGQENAAPIAYTQGVNTLLRLLNPACPHVTAELWEVLNPAEQPLHTQLWPVADPVLAKNDEITLVVQVDGKLRARLVVAADISQPEALAAAKAHVEVAPWLTDKVVAKEVYVPGRLVNFVTSA